jgi:hypothetical protein
MKKKITLITFFIFCTNILLSQNIQPIDSLTTEICISISKLKIEDTNELESIFQIKISTYLDNINISSQKEADSIVDRIYFRLQRNCDRFSKYLDKMEDNKSDWKILSEKPDSKLNLFEYENFMQNEAFNYKEHNGDIVKVILKNNIWAETFQDGTFSKLQFIPNQNGEFNLKFIESNNNMRNNFSVKGDVYKYGAFLIENDMINIWVVSKENQYMSFKLYKKK